MRHPRSVIGDHVSISFITFSAFVSVSCSVNCLTISNLSTRVLCVTCESCYKGNC